MKYSFVLIAYNEAENIINCIQSIEHLQELGNSYEIVVVDDGSQDQTASMVRAYAKKKRKVRLVSDGKNHGRGYGRYRGVEVSTGDYIVMVDADIIMPKAWLTSTLPYMKTHDVAGGIAVPDGDVAFIYRRFKLKPKTVMGSTTITGNNGIYKRRVFAEAQFDPKLREGEDVDFNHSLSKTQYSAICVPGLTVEHQEHKSFPKSMQWLYQSGIGATRQLIRYKEIRLPDIAFGLTFMTFIVAVTFTITAGRWIAFLIPLLGVLGASFLHLRGKFNFSLRTCVLSAGSLFTDAIFIICYYMGRVTGIVIFFKKWFKGQHI
ncbi:MAG TPA: glycosyltransferase family 2 protein [Candidatus Saccharimonadales bacterium]|jgi:glycosyltransferase involved in cell wall biosynthesis